MILDQDQVKQHKKISGNNQLLKGSVFAIITLVWFSFMFAFVDMKWEHFSPSSPWENLHKGREPFIFYFIAFSFFISSIVYSLIFYRKSLQPSDLLVRFAVLLLVFTFVWFTYLLFKYGLIMQEKMVSGGFNIVAGNFPLKQYINVALTFLFLFMFFYPLILLFSKLFFNGFFGTGGFIICAFITAIFHVSLYAMADLERVLNQTRFPIHDIIVILFFTLTSFGIGVLSGEEQKRSVINGRGKNSLRNLTDRH